MRSKTSSTLISLAAFACLAALPLAVDLSAQVAPPPWLRVVRDATPAQGSNWPQFRHDAQHTAATSQELSGSLTLRWKRGFAEWPHVFAELAVVDGRVYLANMDGKVTCLDGATGAVVWEYDTGAAISTTPAVVDGRVHVVNIAGRVVTLSTSGGLLWEYTVPAGVYASPAVQGGLMFFGTVGGTFYAFDTANGAGGPRWSYPVGATIDTAPVVIGGAVAFAAENMRAYALNVGSGALLWSTPLTGNRTWNGHPVASLTTDRIYFSTLAEFMQETSTNRETVDMFAFMSRTGTLSSVAVWADAFVGANRSKLQSAVVVDATTGQPVTQYTVAPDNAVIGGLPFNNWYWGSIRPALWQGSKLYLQTMWRNVIVDLATNRISQPNADQLQTKHFVRGDEQVPVSIGGNRAYGGIGTNAAYLNLTTGARGNLYGVFGSESADFSPMTAPVSSSHYISFPGDGASDRNGTFIVANGRAYFIQYGWVYCFDGTVTTVTS